MADVILSHRPRDAYVMVKKATACAHISRTEFEAQYRYPFLIPMPQRLRYLALARLNRELFAAAEALGWEEPHQEMLERDGSCL